MKTSLPPEEIAICERLRAFRAGIMLSRASIEKKTGVSAELLRNCEDKRTPLRWGIYRKIALEFRLNPMWLATGGMKPHTWFSPEILLLNIPARMLFSAAYREHMQKAAVASFKMSDELLLKFMDALPNIEATPREALLKMGVQTTFEELLRWMRLARDQGAQNSSAKEADEKSAISAETIVDSTNRMPHTSSMAKDKWEQLRQRLKAATEKSGAKSALARHLNVSRQILSMWISGKREPAADKALRLLEWVTEVEAK